MGSARSRSSPRPGSTQRRSASTDVYVNWGAGLHSNWLSRTSRARDASLRPQAVAGATSHQSRDRSHRDRLNSRDLRRDRAAWLAHWFSGLASAAMKQSPLSGSCFALCLVLSFSAACAKGSGLVSRGVRHPPRRPRPMLRSSAATPAQPARPMPRGPPPPCAWAPITTPRAPKLLWSCGAGVPEPAAGRGHRRQLAGAGGLRRALRHLGRALRRQRRLRGPGLPDHRRGRVRRQGQDRAHQAAR